MNLGFYKPIIGSMSDFTRPFQENEQLFKQAKMFWNKLDGMVWFPLIVCIILGAAFVYIYYGPYNNKPGRHYMPVHWWKFFAITFIVSLIVSIASLFLLAPSSLQGADSLKIKIALSNAFGALIVYFVASLVTCYSFPTNAYRFLKF